MRGTDRSPPVSIAVKLWYGNCCSRDYDLNYTSLFVKISISILLLVCILHNEFHCESDIKKCSQYKKIKKHKLYYFL